MGKEVSVWEKGCPGGKRVVRVGKGVSIWEEGGPCEKRGCPCGKRVVRVGKGVSVWERGCPVARVLLRDVVLPRDGDPAGEGV